MPLETFDPTKSHIRDGDEIFQVLNAEGTDWDEAATRAAYQAWLAAQAPAP